MKMKRQPTFDELHAWKSQIIDESIGWAREVNKVDAVQLDAYKAGLSQGITKMLACLRLHGVLKETACT
jgi:hypothetical protein